MQIHFWGHISNTAGSVEKLVLTFAKNQTRYTPVIACKGDLNTQEHMGNLLVYEFAESLLKNRIMNKLLGLHSFTFSSLVPIIENEHPDVLHIHNRQELVDKLVLRLSYKPAIVVHYHRNFEVPSIPKTADLLLTVSHDTKMHILKQSNTNKSLKVLYNPLPESTRDLKPTTQTNSRPVILYGGGGHAWKGLQVLLDALHEIEEDHLIRICGPALDNFCFPEKNIEILGLISHEELLDEIQKADIVVIPSLKEAFGLLALEALYLSKLIVASNVGGLAELLTSECAILTEPGSVKSLANGLKKAIALATIKSNNVSNLREKAHAVARKYTPDVITRKLEEHYDAALAIASRI